MTTIIVVLIGIGVVFIASSLDCTPIKDTFTKIVTNQSVDWSGKNCPSNVPELPGLPSTPAENVGKAEQQAVGPAVTAAKPGKQCPSGYKYIEATGQCHQVGRIL